MAKYTKIAKAVVKGIQLVKAIWNTPRQDSQTNTWETLVEQLFEELEQASREIQR